MSATLAARRHARRNAGTAAAMLSPALLVLAVMLVAPLLLIARFSLDRYDPTELLVEAFTAANYLRFVADPFYRAVLRTTLLVALSSTALCLALGVPMAWRLARMGGRWKAACMLAVVLPLFVGSVVRMVGWIILFARGGLIDGLSRRLTGHGFELMYTPFAVVAGITSINLPIVVLSAQAAMETVEARVIEAAQSLGAAPARAFWRVVWPLSLPGVLAAAILSFILATNAYATPFLLGGPRFQMMAPLVFWEFGTNNNWPFASAMALGLMATTLGLTALAALMVPRRLRG